jgi:hypothetical protein
MGYQDKGNHFVSVCLSRVLSLCRRSLDEMEKGIDLLQSEAQRRNCKPEIQDAPNSTTRVLSYLERHSLFKMQALKFGHTQWVDKRVQQPAKTLEKTSLLVQLVTSALVNEALMIGLLQPLGGNSLPYFPAHNPCRWDATAGEARKA